MKTQDTIERIVDNCKNEIRENFISNDPMFTGNATLERILTKALTQLHTETEREENLRCRNMVASFVGEISPDMVVKIQEALTKDNNK